mmetsp:Transcript_12752/g.32089  ORF Transcript_12752/g.32089 Transcript_12752/m.32089 type:complete len:81 (+) Transcript_12752:2-244(+)
MSYQGGYCCTEIAMFSLLMKFRRMTMLDDCDPYKEGHSCLDGLAYNEEGDDSAAMSYQGGYDAGYAAGQAWGAKVTSLNP